jgi:metal-responsive CopG/Arc/MetJ family transcriptional regulator
MKRFSVGVSLDKEIVEKIDSARGMIPRSRFIENVIAEHLRTKK